MLPSALAEEEPRELCFILAALNYEGQQTIVTPESFRRPNFPLVYKILSWFSRVLSAPKSERASLDANLAQGTGGESDERRFSQQTSNDCLAQFIELIQFLTKQLGHPIDGLDLVSLYKSDLGSCRELLKLARPIYEAAQLAASEQAAFGSDHEWPARELEQRARLLEQVELYLGKQEEEEHLLGDKMESRAREVSSEPPRPQFERLAQLAGEIERALADEESQFCVERQEVIDRPLEARIVAQVLERTRGTLEGRAKELELSNEGLQGDVEKLERKLEAKEAEISEARARLGVLLLEAPAYARQLEQVRSDYARVYANYVSHYRNLEYLKSCVYSQAGQSGSEPDDYDEPLPLSGSGQTSPAGGSNTSRPRLELAAAEARARPAPEDQSAGLARDRRAEVSATQEDGARGRPNLGDTLDEGKPAESDCDERTSLSGRRSLAELESGPSATGSPGSSSAMREAELLLSEETAAREV